MSESIAVLYEQDDAVAVITLNRPTRLNAINDQLVQELSDALTLAQDDHTVRAIILTGAGRGFCSGADLEENFKPDFSPEYGRDYIKSKYGPLMAQFTSLPKPIIGAINGTAAGAGAAIALACDLRVMSNRASLLYAFVNIALGPDAGAGWFLARQVGYSRAFELAISGKKISAEKCLELGLTNRVVPAEELMENVLAWAHQLGKGPTLAYGATKDDLQFAMNSPLGATIDREADNQVATFGSHDLKEGIQAFMEKRRPAFKGR